jgi:hypothetical protein
VDFSLVDCVRNLEFYHYCYNLLETKAAGNLIFQKWITIFPPVKQKTGLISIFLFKTQRYKWRALHSYTCCSVSSWYSYEFEYSLFNLHESTQYLESVSWSVSNKIVGISKCFSLFCVKIFLILSPICSRRWHPIHE